MPSSLGLVCSNWVGRMSLWNLGSSSSPSKSLSFVGIHTSRLQNVDSSAPLAEADTCAPHREHFVNVGFYSFVFVLLSSYFCAYVKKKCLKELSMETNDT